MDEVIFLESCIRPSFLGNICLYSKQYTFLCERESFNNVFIKVNNNTQTLVSVSS